MPVRYVGPYGDFVMADWPWVPPEWGGEEPALPAIIHPPPVWPPAAFPLPTAPPTAPPAVVSKSCFPYRLAATENKACPPAPPENLAPSGTEHTMVAPAQEPIPRGVPARRVKPPQQLAELNTPLPPTSPHGEQQAPTKKEKKHKKESADKKDRRRRDEGGKRSRTPPRERSRRRDDPRGSGRADASRGHFSAAAGSHDPTMARIVADQALQIERQRDLIHTQIRGAEQAHARRIGRTERRRARLDAAAVDAAAVEGSADAGGGSADNPGEVHEAEHAAATGAPRRRRRGIPDVQVSGQPNL